MRLIGRQRQAKTRGQVIVEMAVSLVGVVMFTYVVLKVWTWMSTNIMQRQGAFQTSRIAAGQMEMTLGEIPGQPVPFTPVPLQIIGAPGFTSPGTGGTSYPPLVENGCVPGNPDVRAAQDIEALADAAMAEYNDLLALVDMMRELLRLDAEMRIVQAQIDQLVNIDIPAIQAAIAQGYVDLDDVQNNQLPPAQAALAACLALPPPPNCAAEQADVDALLAQEAALQAQIAADEATEAAMQLQLANLQAQMLALQAQFDALVASSPVPIDLSNMPLSLQTQAQATMDQANLKLAEANDLYQQARDLMNSGATACQ